MVDRVKEMNDCRSDSVAEFSERVCDGRRSACGSKRTQGPYRFRATGAFEQTGDDGFGGGGLKPKGFIRRISGIESYSSSSLVGKSRISWS
ncbi:hypothetical protein CRG98_029439 [Punica granatum]|uniref:Uncharacterized protein n=1 Tax=Punica granatum TaxID=22663 RepID=A0A2I0J1U3_PUNGR|nr:hypothetical protein CRG98_029439 [Punica granatum]